MAAERRHPYSTLMLRRAQDLAIDWDDRSGRLILFNCRTHEKLSVTSRIIELLLQMSDWIEERAARTLAEDHTIDMLLQLGILEVCPSGARSSCDTPHDAWAHWGSAARYFHSASAHVRYLTHGPERDALVRTVTADEQPPLFSSRDHSMRVSMPHPQEIAASFTDVLMRRRTHRSFSSLPVELGTVATLLHYVFRPQGFKDAGPFGKVPIRTSPCAGARNEIECYIAAINVTNLRRGLYHYNSLEHSLDLIADAADRDAILNVCFDQPALVNAPLIAFTTAVIGRVSYKYRHPRAYRLLGYNVGHTAQTFVLTATALGLGTYQSAAFDDRRMSSLLELDYPNELPTYVLAAGTPLTDGPQIGVTDEFCL